MNESCISKKCFLFNLTSFVQIQENLINTFLFEYLTSIKAESINHNYETEQDIKSKNILESKTSADWLSETNGNLGFLISDKNQVFYSAYNRNSSEKKKYILPRQPRTGFIKALKEEWEFYRHGVGICFESLDTSKIIDAHREINKKRAFDSWRLTQYFESLNYSHVIWRKEKIAVDDEKNLDYLFEELEQENRVKLISKQYKLYELSNSG